MAGHPLNDILLRDQLKEKMSKGNSQRITTQSFVKIYIQLWYASTFFIFNRHMYNYYQIMTKHFHVLMLVIIWPKKNLQRTTPPPPPPPKKGERCLHTLVLYNSIYTRHVSVSHIKKTNFSSHESPTICVFLHRRHF